MKKILCVYTGGTVCSAVSDNTRSLNTASTDEQIISILQSKFENCSFESSFVLDTFSENMDLSKITALIKHLQSRDISKYSGIIVFHGTDTLAFTCAFLNVYFGKSKTPIIPVSANKPIEYEDSNGFDNLFGAINLILSEKANGVCTVYKNTNGIIYVHKGNEIRQCERYSENFFSKGMTKLSDITEDFFRQNNSLKSKALNCEFTKKVLTVFPYTGLDYSAFNIDNVSAILHFTYHSETVCSTENSENGIGFLIEKCKIRQIPIFLSPCKYDENTEVYESIHSVFKNNENAVFTTCGYTDEYAYAKLLFAINSFSSLEEIIGFMNSEN